MQRGAMDISEHFARLTCILEDAHAISIEGQSHSATQCEQLFLVQQLHEYIHQISDSLKQIEHKL